MIFEHNKAILPFSFVLKSIPISQNVGKVITPNGHFQINFKEDIDGSFDNIVSLNINKTIVDLVH